MKVSRHPQRFTCAIEVASAQEKGGDNNKEDVIRVATTSGQNLLSMTITTEIGRHLTRALLQATPMIDVSGHLSIINNDEFQLIDEIETIPLDQLVADAVSPKMLEDEPEALQHLAEFRARLLKSLEHIDEAIASLPKP